MPIVSKLPLATLQALEQYRVRSTAARTRSGSGLASQQMPVDLTDPIVCSHRLCDMERAGANTA